MWGDKRYKSESFWQCAPLTLSWGPQKPETHFPSAWEGAVEILLLGTLSNRSEILSWNTKYWMEGSNPFQPLAGVVGAVCVVLVSAVSRWWELELLELFSSPGWGVFGEGHFHSWLFSACKAWTSLCCWLARGDAPEAGNAALNAQLRALFSLSTFPVTKISESHLQAPVLMQCSCSAPFACINAAFRAVTYAWWSHYPSPAPSWSGNSWQGLPGPGRWWLSPCISAYARAAIPPFPSCSGWLGCSKMHLGRWNFWAVLPWLEPSLLLWLCWRGGFDSAIILLYFYSVALLTGSFCSSQVCQPWLMKSFAAASCGVDTQDAVKGFLLFYFSFPSLMLQGWCFQWEAVPPFFPQPRMGWFGIFRS